MWLIYLMYREQSISLLPRVCNHEFLQSFASQWVKPIDVIKFHLHSWFCLRIIKNLSKFLVIVHDSISCVCMCLASPLTLSIPEVCMCLHVNWDRFCLPVCLASFCALHVHVNANRPEFTVLFPVYCHGYIVEVIDTRGTETVLTMEWMEC